MIRLGITGHQTIPEAAREFLLDSLRREIDRASLSGPLWGVTSLAVGADQMFAELVLQARGKLHVIVPSTRYETTFRTEGLTRYRRLIAAAEEVEHLKFNEPTEEAFFAAGRRVVDLSDMLLAVWDGKPSRGLGGTADIVNYAQSSGRKVTIVWPAGVAR